MLAVRFRGGIRAAMTHQDFGLINTWLRNIKDVYRMHREELDALPDDDARSDRLAEFNVLEQVHNLAKTTCIQTAWKRHGRPHLHGWVYGVDNGLLKSIVEFPVGSPIDGLYQIKNP